jgi:hypothetical protein
MSSRLVKNGNGLLVPDDEMPLLELVVRRSGTQLKSPLPPNEVIKLLNGISIDVMFAALKPAEAPKIETLQ